MSEILKGTTKWYNGRKGFGFVEREDGQKDVFIHTSAIKAAGLRFLNEGDKIEFQLSEDSGKGPAAINIKKIS